MLQSLATLLDAVTNKTRSESFKARDRGGERGERGVRAHLWLTFASPVLAGRSPSVVEVLGGRGDLSSLHDCGGRPESRRFYQRNQETGKRAGIDYLDQIGQDGAFVPCSLGAGPSKRFVDPD